jgi:hypothetical protein
MEFTTDIEKIKEFTAEQINNLIGQLEAGMQDVLKVEKNIPKAIKLQNLIGDCIDIYSTKKFGKTINQLYN